MHLFDISAFFIIEILKKRSNIYYDHKDKEPRFSLYCTRILFQYNNEQHSYDVKKIVFQVFFFEKVSLEFKGILDSVKKRLNAFEQQLNTQRHQLTVYKLYLCVNKWKFCLKNRMKVFSEHFKVL